MNGTAFKPMKHLGGFAMLPAKPGTCSECAVAHDPKHPHNAQSLFYQYKFYGDNGRWPTWGDAMSHCSADIQQFWKTELVNKGVKPEKLEPSKPESPKNKLQLEVAR